MACLGRAPFSGDFNTTWTVGEAVSQQPYSLRSDHLAADDSRCHSVGSLLTNCSMPTSPENSRIALSGFVGP
jgi:hypothetical protein